MINNASNHLIEACKEFNEAKRIENEGEEHPSSGQTYEPDHDSDSWDKEY